MDRPEMAAVADAELAAPPPGPALGWLLSEWEDVAAQLGQPRFRAKQVFQWLHRRHAQDPSELSNVGKLMTGVLKRYGQLNGDSLWPLTVERVHRADDDTRKLLVRLHDDLAIETVLLPRTKNSLDADVAAMDDDDGDDRPHDEADEAQHIRLSQCISSQVGCAMGCVFCASGIAGLARHLTAAEIVAQIYAGRAHYQPGEQLSGVVFMGMGEPLHNYDETARSIRLLTSKEGIHLSPRRITVSTSGLIDAIDRLGRDFEGKVNLAISLHQADDAKRSALMPVNRKHPLKLLMKALRRYPLPPRRRITVEYTLVAGQNDSDEDATRLIALLRGIPVKVNLIPMNPIEHSKLGPPEMTNVHRFQQRLRGSGLPAFLRRRRGDNVSAACGQLVMLDREPSKAFARRQAQLSQDVDKPS